LKRLVCASSVVVLVALAGASGLPAIVACNTLPDNTCYGERVNALTRDAGSTDPGCSTCLQRSCCDEVGACQADAACVEAFRAAHRCVLERGAGDESECVSPLGASTSSGRRLYECMRARCGGNVPSEAACGISSCRVDQAVVLIATPTCDRCVTGSCCKEVNDCYGDRRCKLAVECIARECTSTVGRDMEFLAEIGDEGVRAVRDAVCSNTPLPVGVGPDRLGGSCIERCLVDFAPVTGGTTDDANARCLAFSVFACSAGAKCGAACAEPAPLRDAAAE